VFEVVLIAGTTLAIVLYGQARLAAREIRRNRADQHLHRPKRLLIEPRGR